MYMSVWDVLVLMAYFIFRIIPWNAGNFLTSCKPVSCLERTLHHGVWIIFCRVLIIVVYEFYFLVWHHGFEQLCYVIIDTKDVVLMNAESVCCLIKLIEIFKCCLLWYSYCIGMSRGFIGLNNNGRKKNHRLGLFC